MFGIKFVKCKISCLDYIPLSQVLDNHVQLILFIRIISENISDVVIFLLPNIGISPKHPESVWTCLENSQWPHTLRMACFRQMCFCSHFSQFYCTFMPLDNKWCSFDHKNHNNMAQLIIVIYQHNDPMTSSVIECHKIEVRALQCLHVKVFFLFFSDK